MRHNLIDLITLTLDERTRETAAEPKRQDPYIRKTIGYYETREEMFANIIEACYAALDEVNLPLLLSFINQAVTDYASAEEQRNVCNVNWIKGLKISPEGKCRVADMLIEKCQPWLQAGIPMIWQSLAARDRVAMNAVILTTDEE